MINLLQIKNFKTHKNTELALGNLTILCGQNGVGKSSVIQSLLLLRQTHQKNRLQEGLDLNKPLCEIGSAQDALYQYAEDSVLGVYFEVKKQKFKLEYLFEDSNSKTTFMKKYKISGDFDDLQNISLFNSNFQYLSAARLAPRESYPKDDYEVEQNKQLSIEKGQGELVAHFLNHYGSKEIPIEAVKHNGCEDLSLLKQVAEWEKEISQNINIKVQELGRGYEIKYNFSGATRLPTNDFRAENVGFGITYALPIIVAILFAQKDSLILIENPEAHLHPYGQSKLAELIALAAQNGIQIIVETHSDHIINGILVASKNFENNKQGIDKEKVKIYYFDRDESKHASSVQEIAIQVGGKIDKQPLGFFDQLQKDLSVIMGF